MYLFICMFFTAGFLAIFTFAKPAPPLPDPHPNSLLTGIAGFSSLA